MVDITMDVIDVIAGIKNITDFDATTRQKQNNLNVSDVWHFWDILLAKYDIINISNVLLNFTKDADVKAVISSAEKSMQNFARSLEQAMLEFAIPMPSRPPEGANSTINLEVITDKYVFRRFFTLVKDLIPILATAFVNSTSPKARKLFKDHLNDTMVLYDNLSAFGEMKGYITNIPMYMP